MRLGDGKYINDQLPRTQQRRLRYLLLRGAPAFSTTATAIFSGSEWLNPDSVGGRQVLVKGATRVNGVYCTIIEVLPTAKRVGMNRSADDSVTIRVFIGTSDNLPHRIEQEVTQGAYSITQIENFTCSSAVPATRATRRAVPGRGRSRPTPIRPRRLAIPLRQSDPQPGARRDVVNVLVRAPGGTGWRD